MTVECCGRPMAEHCRDGVLVDVRCAICGKRPLDLLMATPLPVDPGLAEYHVDGNHFLFDGATWERVKAAAPAPEQSFADRMLSLGAIGPYAGAQVYVDRCPCQLPGPEATLAFTEPPPLTLDTLNAAIRSAAEDRSGAEAEVTAAQHRDRFLASVPEELRSNEILLIAERLRQSWLGNPLHPADARRLRDRVRELLARDGPVS